MKRSSTGHRSSASINASNHHERRSKHRSIPSQTPQPVRPSSTMRTENRLKHELKLALQDLEYEKQNKESLNYMITQLKGKINHLQGHQSSIASAQKDFEKQLSEQLQDRDQAEQKLRQMTVKNEKLEELVAYHKQRHEQDRAEITDMRQHLGSIENRLKSTNQRKQEMWDLQYENQDLCERLNHITDQNKDFCSRLGHATEENQDLGTRLGHALEENRDLRPQLEHVTQNNNIMADKLDQTEKEVVNLKQQLQRFQNQAHTEAQSIGQETDRLRNENEGAVRDLNLAYGQLQQQQAQLSEHRITIEDLTQVSADWELKYNVLQEENQDLKQNRADLEAKIKSLKQSVERNLDNKSDLESKNKPLMQSLERNFEDRARIMQRARDHKENEMNQLSVDDSFATFENGAQTDRMQLRSDSDLRANNLAMTARGGLQRVNWEDTTRTQTVLRESNRFASHERGNTSAPRRYLSTVSSALSSPKGQLRASCKAFQSARQTPYDTRRNSPLAARRPKSTVLQRNINQIRSKLTDLYDNQATLEEKMKSFDQKYSRQ